MSDTNRNVAEHFNRLVSYYKLAGESHRANSFARAANAIMALRDDVATFDWNKNHIQGIGGSTIGEIKEFLTTGSSARLKDLESKHSTKAPDLADLQKIPGVGIIQALELWKRHNVSNVNELAKIAQNGGISDPDLVTRIMSVAGGDVYIERSIVQDVADDLLAKLCRMADEDRFGDQKCAFAGSMRRKREKIRDIDIVIAMHPLYDSGHIYHMLSNLGYQVERGGTQKIRVKLPYNGGQKFIGCDIVVTTSEEYACAITYSTGSKEFNVGMRGHAKRLGWTLNEHRLYRPDPTGKGELSRHPDTEQDLFMFLGLEWVEPEDRLNETNVRSVQR